MELLICMGLVWDLLVLAGLRRSSLWWKRRERRGIPGKVSVMLWDPSIVYLFCNSIVWASLGFHVLLLYIICRRDIAALYRYGPDLLMGMLNTFLYLLVSLVVLAVHSRQRIFWNEEGIWIDPVFGPRRSVRYEEIQRIDPYVQRWAWPRRKGRPGLVAYDRNGKQLFRAADGMYCYWLFLHDMAERLPNLIGVRHGWWVGDA